MVRCLLDSLGGVLDGAGDLFIAMAAQPSTATAIAAPLIGERAGTPM